MAAGWTVVLVGFGTLYAVLYLAFVAATEWRLKAAHARGDVHAVPGPRLHRFTQNALATNPDIDYRYGAYHVPDGHVVWIRGRVAPQGHYLVVVLYDRLMQSVADGTTVGPTVLNGDQLRIGADGAFEIALCAEDPGAANWLDVSTVPHGMVVVRHIGGAPDEVETLEVRPLLSGG